jgi:transposase-like protein
MPGKSRTDGLPDAVGRNAQNPRRAVKRRHAAALEARLLTELVAKIKNLNTVVAVESGSIDLRCPCGAVILAPIPVISDLKDRQRGLLKSRIRRHLRADHGISEETISVVLKEAFAD